MKKFLSTRRLLAVSGAAALLLIFASCKKSDNDNPDVPVAGLMDSRSETAPVNLPSIQLRAGDSMVGSFSGRLAADAAGMRAQAAAWGGFLKLIAIRL